MIISHVLCAVNLHDTPHHVFEAAVQLAERHLARLTVVHAVPKHERFNERSVSRAERIRFLTAAARRRVPSVHFAVQQGTVAGVILLHARAGDADVLVLGGGRGTAQTRRRSDATLRTVMRRSRVPLLLVPDEGQSREGGGTIVCATTLRRDAPGFLEYVDRLAASWLGRPAPLKVVHVIDAASSAAEGSRATSDAVHMRAWRRLRAAMPTAARVDGTADGDVLYGDAAAGILAAAGQIDASLIVLGAPGRFGLATLLGRSAITDVVRRAACPILVVPAVEGRQSRLLAA